MRNFLHVLYQLDQWRKRTGHVLVVSAHFFCHQVGSPAAQHPQHCVCVRVAIVIVSMWQFDPDLPVGADSHRQHGCGLMRERLLI